MNIMVTYSHCIKATPDQLDREPWYQYERREKTIRLEGAYCAYDDIGEQEWHAYIEGELLPIAVENTDHDAMQVAMYQLMKRSREEMEVKARESLAEPCPGVVGRMGV